MGNRKFIGLILVFILIFATCSVFAGEMKVEVNEKEEKQKDAEVEEVKKEKDEKIEIDFDKHEDWGIKGNGGPMLSFLQLDFSDLNDALTSVDDGGNSFSKFSEDYLVMFGGGGLGGLKKGSRFGGYGMEGKLTTSSNNMKANLKVAYGGFLYEKGILAFKGTGTDVAIGALMGGGSAELTLIYESLGDDFDNTIASPKMNVLQKDFVALEPRINLHQQIGAFVGFDLSVGYLLSYDFGETWKINDHVINGPLDNMKAPTASARLTFGF